MAYVKKEKNNPDADALEVEIDPIRAMQKFDKVHVRIKRVQKKKGKDSFGVTQSVEIGKVYRRDIITSQQNVNALNASQDWQNNTSEGEPVIMWHFPAGKVKTGQAYKAKDLYNEDEGLGDHPIGLFIDISKQIGE